MKDKIPQFLQEKLQFKSPKVLTYPDEIKQFIKEYGEFYNFNLGDDLTSIFKLIQLRITELPTCSYPNCKNKIEIVYGKLTNGCSRSHRLKITNLEKYGVEHNQLNPEIAEKTKKTNMERYGTDHHLKNVQIREKVKLTVTEKYGVDNVFKSSIIKEQIKDSLQEKYNADHPMRSEEIKNKFNSTMHERYGCEWAQQSEEIRETIKQNNIQKFGVENPMQNEEILEKAKNTNLSKYGVTCVLQNEEIKEKAKITNLEKYGVENVMFSKTIIEKWQKNAWTRKEYKWKTGEISFVQGYEPTILKELEDQGYTFNRVLTSTSDMPEIWYDYNGEKHRYYPDIYIPSENKIIEVKSTWTLKIDEDKNQAKFEATKELGYDFRLEVR